MHQLENATNGLGILKLKATVQNKDSLSDYLDQKYESIHPFIHRSLVT